MGSNFASCRKCGRDIPLLSQVGSVMSRRRSIFILKYLQVFFAHVVPMEDIILGEPLLFFL